MNASGGLVALK